MDKNILKDYINSKGSITVPEIQAQFSLPYSEARADVEKLVHEGFLSDIVEGTTYCVKVQQRPKVEVMTDFFDPIGVGKKLGGFFDYEDDDLDDDFLDDDDAEDKEDDSSLDKKLFSFGLPRNKRPFPSVHNSADEELLNHRQRMLEKAAAQMRGYDAKEQSFTCSMSVAYPDGTPFRAKLQKIGQRLFVSDCGQTYKYLCQNNSEKFAEQYHLMEQPPYVKVWQNEICRYINFDNNLESETISLLHAVNDMVAHGNYENDLLTSEELELVERLSKSDNGRTTMEILKEGAGKKYITMAALLYNSYVDDNKLRSSLKELQEYGLLASAQSGYYVTDKMNNRILAALEQVFFDDSIDD